MKRIITVFISVCLLSIGVACSSEQQAGKKPQEVEPVKKAVPVSKTSRAASVFRTINSQEAQSLIGSRKDLLMVDLREASELKEGYISGSVLIPMSQLAKGSKSLPTDRPLLLICAVGGRSFAVGRYFSSKGYPEIYNLKGGVSAWKKAGFPLQYN